METHPIQEGFIPDKAKTIIIGTFPPKAEYENNSNFFFYSSVRNHFWNRMEKLFPQYKLKKTSTKLKSITPEQNKIDKENFSRDNEIGFLDVFTKIKRKVKNSSKDKDLDPKEDITKNGILLKILDKHPNIDRICCTYKLAYDTLLCGLDKKLLAFKKNNLSANEEEYIFDYNTRKIQIFLLFPATRSRQKNDLKDKQYRELIFRE